MYHELRNDENIMFSSGIKVAEFTRRCLGEIDFQGKEKIENNEK